MTDERPKPAKTTHHPAPPNDPAKGDFWYEMLGGGSVKWEWNGKYWKDVDDSITRTSK